MVVDLTMSRLDLERDLCRAVAPLQHEVAILARIRPSRSTHLKRCPLYKSDAADNREVSITSGGGAINKRELTNKKHKHDKIKTLNDLESTL